MPNEDDHASRATSGPDTAPSRTILSPGAATVDDHRLAVAVANRAGELLVELRARLVAEGAEAQVLKDTGDRRAHELIVDALAERVAAGDAVLSEEGRRRPGPPGRNAASGSSTHSTAPASSASRLAPTGPSTWRSSIDGVPAAGAVALPALRITARHRPPRRRHRPPPTARHASSSVAAGRRRPPPGWPQHLGGELVEMGSAGAKAMAVVRGEADVYAHSGGQYEWDSCAPVGRRRRRRAARVAPRRLGPALQQRRPLPARPADLPARAGRTRSAGPGRLPRVTTGAGTGSAAAGELKVVRYEIADRIATVTLDRPDRLNAWTGRMHTEYRRALALAEDDPDVRVVVVTGAGRGFCAGADTTALSGHVERGGYDPGTGDELAEPGYGVSPEFDHDFAFQFGLTKPVIAAINGPAAGVGLVLACYCDLRFAAAGAKLTTAHGKLNLPAEYGLSWLLPRLIGLTRANDLLLSSRTFRAEEAFAMGLVNAVVEPDELLAHTYRYAGQLATTVSRGSLAATKRQVYLDLHRGVGDAVAESGRRLAQMMTEPDFAEGVAALTEKRPPDFA